MSSLLTLLNVYIARFFSVCYLTHQAYDLSSIFLSQIYFTPFGVSIHIKPVCCLTHNYLQDCITVRHNRGAAFHTGTWPSGYDTLHRGRVNVATDRAKAWSVRLRCFEDWNGTKCFIRSKRQHHWSLKVASGCWQLISLIFHYWKEKPASMHYFK